MKLSDLRPTPGSVQASLSAWGGATPPDMGRTRPAAGRGRRRAQDIACPQPSKGGQTPLWKRVPKRGFKNPLRKSYAFVNVGQLNEVFPDGAEITPKALKQHGLIKKYRNGVKILGDGPLFKKFIVKAHKFSKSAKEKILAAGGQAIALLPEPEQPKPKDVREVSYD
jgi:large subunit ribosomal protein L15